MENGWNYKIYRINIETETTKEKLLKRMKQYCTFGYKFRVFTIFLKVSIEKVFPNSILLCASGF